MSVLDLDVHLAGIRARDTDAFARWMASAEGSMRLSLRSFAVAVDVEAVLQEALLRVWQVAPRFEPDGQPNGLLRLGVRIARNLAVSEVRRTRAKPAPIDDLERVLAETQERSPELPDPLLRSVIGGCAEQLPEKPRAAFRARLGLDVRLGLEVGLDAGPRVDDDEALAERLHMRLNTFLQNFGRARRLLAECLRKHGVAFAWDDAPEGST